MFAPDLRYVAPAIDGFVLWSNMSHDDQGRKIPLDEIGRKYCSIVTAERFDITEEAIHVTLFIPNDGQNQPVWAIYVSEVYSEIVNQAKRNLFQLLEELSHMEDDYFWGEDR